MGMRSIGKNMTLTTYPQVVHYLLRTFATDEDISGTNVVITIFARPSNKTALRSIFSEDLAIALWFEEVHKNMTWDHFYQATRYVSTVKVESLLGRT